MPLLSPKPRTETARAAAVLIRERLVACGSLREYLPRLPSTYKYNIPWRMSKAPDSALTARSHARGNCDASGALAKGERPGAVVQACSVCRSSCALDDKYIRRGNRQQLDIFCRIECDFFNATHDSRRLRFDETQSDCYLSTQEQTARHQRGMEVME